MMDQYHKSHITKKISMDHSEFPVDIEAYKRQSEIEERYITNWFRKRRNQIEGEKDDEFVHRFFHFHFFFIIMNLLIYCRCYFNNINIVADLLLWFGFFFV